MDWMRLAVEFLTNLSTTAAFVLVAVCAVIAVGLIVRGTTRQVRYSRGLQHEKEMAAIASERDVALNSRELVSHARTVPRDR